jgi:hypothetical protein
LGIPFILGPVGGGEVTPQSLRQGLNWSETVNMIRKGRVRWVAKDDVSAQARFVAKLFGIAA